MHFKGGICLFDTTNNLDDIPEIFTKYTSKPIKKDKKFSNSNTNKNIKNSDMLFLLLIVLIFYDNKI